MLPARFVRRGRFALIPLVGVALGCHRHPKTDSLISAHPKVSWPGIKYEEALQPKLTDHPRLWIYVPDDKRRTHPCVFIAAAGSPMYTGMSLSEGDRDEHLPYVKAGYTVVAYDVSGPRTAENDVAAATKAMKLFAKREVGIDNGKAAIDYALHHLKIDPLRLYAVGHSSAATLALQLSAVDSRIRGCVAYAPVTDIKGFLSDEVVNEIHENAPETYRALFKFSPVALVDSLHCPTMLFTAADDDTVPTDTVQHFARALSAVNKDVELDKAASGGHYDSMISQGIPDGIAWLGRARKPRK